MDENGESIKFNMKPQTLLVDFDPDRVFVMQEQKAQVYNVNTDEAGNSKLRERIEEELRISPVIVMNKDKIVQITATDILKAVSEYSKSRGVAEETIEIPIDMSLLDIDAIRVAIERENELGSKAGLTIKGADGDGDDIDVPNEKESTDTTGEAGKTTGTETQTDEPGDSTQTEEKGKDTVKQFRSYYARILFFAFLTKNIVISLKRFQTKSNVSYTEQDMKRWWNEKDLLGFDNEKVISKDMSADDTVKMILKNCTKNIS